jgi:hypothetical protein
VTEQQTDLQQDWREAVEDPALIRDISEVETAFATADRESLDE